MPDFTRKRNRLRHYDYGQFGVYFVTINSRNNETIFGHIGDLTSCKDTISTLSTNSISCPPAIPSIMLLSDTGRVVEEEIYTLDRLFEDVSVDIHVVMPNHVHMIISIANHNQKSDRSLTLSGIVGQWKRSVSLKLGFSPWQRSFYDHIIRNEDDYRRIAEYIYNNPEKWNEDKYNPG